MSKNDNRTIEFLYKNDMAKSNKDAKKKLNADGYSYNVKDMHNIEQKAVTIWMNMRAGTFASDDSFKRDIVRLYLKDYDAQMRIRKELFS